MTDTANKDNGDMNNKKKSYSDKRKRINRIKTALIITILVLILIPTILCIFLGMRLSRLEKKLELLTYNLGMQDELDYTRSDSRYAYASDFGPDEIINTSKDVANEDLINKDLINKDVIGKDSIDTDVTGNQNVNDKIIKEEDYIKQANNITEESIHIQNIDNNVGNKNPGNNNPGNNNPVNNNPGNNTATNNNINSNIDINNNDNKNYNYDLNKDKDIDIDKDIHSESINDTDSDNDGNKLNLIDDIDDEDNKDLIYYGKKVYLTFDDGPSYITDDVLDILAEYNVKATFFVVGHTDKKSKERYMRIVDEGHTLGIHSYSHKYSEIYKSVEDFDKDFTKLWQLLYDTTGYTPTIYRFPGGSLNQVNSYGMEEFIRYLNDKNIIYYDWNVVNGDAAGVEYTEEQMVDNVLNGVKRKKTSIVLMHDGGGKEKTAATLPALLEALISGGAEILPIDDTVPPIQQIKAKSVE